MNGMDEFQRQIDEAMAYNIKAQLETERFQKILEKQIFILAVANADMRLALEEIDAVAVSKKAGATKKMQAIARKALAPSE